MTPRGNRLERLLDGALAPFAMAAAALLKHVRGRGLERMPACRKALMRVGVLPLREHYYEPFVRDKNLEAIAGQKRQLKGIDWNADEQLALLESFSYGDELTRLPFEDAGNGAFYYRNSYFDVGDSEFLYSMVRRFKPRRMLEVGSGYSTLMAREALARNAADDPRHACDHVCIEPYENDWLEERGVRVIRRPVQEVELERFEALGENDILFIDSSHTIRPGGDVLFLYQEVMPRLAAGVLVHIHDFFAPFHYPKAFLLEKVLLWNEQYLVEALLTNNARYRIVGALSYLKAEYPDALAGTCPMFAKNPAHAVGSLWLRVAGEGG